MQNYNIITTRTPRFKFVFFFFNLNKIIFFFNEALSIFYFQKKNSNFNSFFFLFYKFFFSRQFKKIIKKINFKFVGFYDNKLVRSLAFWIFKISILNLNKFSSFKKFHYLTGIQKRCPSLRPFIAHNQHLLSFPILNLRFFKRNYKNFFFFLMLCSVNHWFDFNNTFNFYYNFVIVNQDMFTFYPFCSNYFLNVYNF
jgi:hypothetical protein